MSESDNSVSLFGVILYYLRYPFGVLKRLGKVRFTLPQGEDETVEVKEGTEIVEENNLDTLRTSCLLWCLILVIFFAICPFVVITLSLLLTFQ